MPEINWNEEDTAQEALIGSEDDGATAGLSPGAIALKYNDVVLHGMRPFLWTKLVFIGQGRAGKTSLLKNLTNQPFDANEQITDGADVCVVNSSAWEKLERGL